MARVDKKAQRNKISLTLYVMLAVISTIVCAFAAYSMIYGYFYIGLIILVVTIFLWIELIYFSYQKRRSAIDVAEDEVGRERMRISGFTSLNQQKSEKTEMIFCEKGIILRMNISSDSPQVLYANYSQIQYSTKKNGMILDMVIQGEGNISFITNNQQKLPLFIRYLSQTKAIKKDSETKN